MDLNVIKRRLQFPGVTQENLPQIVEETLPYIYDITPKEPNSEIFKVPDDFEFSLSKGPEVFVSELGLNDPAYDFRLNTRKGQKSHINFQKLLLTIF